MKNVNNKKQKRSELLNTDSEDKIKNIEKRLIDILKEYRCLNDIGDISDDDLTFFKDLCLSVNRYFLQKYR